MPLTTTYVTTAELKSYLRIGDTDDDTELDFAIEAASRAIDQAANRRFGQDDTAQQRFYSYVPSQGAGSTRVLSQFRGLESLEVDDISTTSGLLVDLDDDEDLTYGASLTLNSDFVLWPFNALGQEGMPATRIVLTDNASESFPRALRGVRVTAQFGFPAVPEAIKKATLMQATRFFKRRDAAFGVAGSPEFGNELRLFSKVDADVMVIVAPYRRHWAVA